MDVNKLMQNNMAQAANKESVLNQQTGVIKVSQPKPSGKEESVKVEISCEGKASKEQEDIENEILDKAIEEVNHRLLATDREFRYKIHDKTRMIMVQVMDKKTDEIIRELPPENRLDAIAKVWELAGLIIDKKL